MPEGSWRDLAACIDAPQEWFFIEEVGQDTKKAREVCKTCPVIEQCRDYAIRTRQQYGVWGGLTIGQLRRFVKQQPKTEFKHGYSAYRRHGCRCNVCVADRDRNYRMGAERDRIRREMERAQKRANGEKRRKRGEPPQHGTASGYTNHGCRCDECREAAREAREARKARRAS